VSVSPMALVFPGVPICPPALPRCTSPTAEGCVVWRGRIYAVAPPPIGCGWIELPLAGIGAPIGVGLWEGFETPPDLFPPSSGLLAQQPIIIC
jgi:hypothetical protein